MEDGRQSEGSGLDEALLMHNFYLARGRHLPGVCRHGGRIRLFSPSLFRFFVGFYLFNVISFKYMPYEVLDV
jgi:hypothetical protein